MTIKLPPDFLDRPELWSKCCVCNGPCPPHAFWKNNDAKEPLCFCTFGDDGRGASRPSYFLGELDFCSARCSLHYHEQQKRYTHYPTD